MKRKRLALLQSIVALILCVAMLAGSTFAWFTDSVINSGNIIKSGKLDLAVYWTEDLNDGWNDVKNAGTNKIFDYKYWEPGFTQVRYIKIVNAGDLAFRYALEIKPNGTVSKLADVIDVYAAETIDGRADLTKPVGTLSDVISGKITAKGELTEGEVVLAIALKMREDAGNEYQNLSIGDSFGITLSATQFTYEEDSFGDDYDTDAGLPGLKGDAIGSADVSVTDGKVTESATITTNTDVKATVPAGVKVDGSKMSLSVTAKEGTDSNITAGEGENLAALDVHIEGVASDNTTPIIVELGAILSEGFNQGNMALYHVENGAPVAMTQVLSLTELDAHNEYYYDPATGNVTVAMATFSEVAVVADKESVWEGNFDYSWYTNAVAPVDGETVTEYIISNADQLAAFGKIVGGMAEGIELDTFKHKTVKLLADINLGYGVEGHTYSIFHPIGYYYTDDKNEDGTKGDYYSTVSSFEGTFDGNGHTIANFYQNTWEIKGDYDGNYYKDAMGLFGYVVNGTVKNLTVDNFSSDGEFTPTGVIAAYAVNSTFENIAITNCNPRVYNTGNGGIVGIGGNSDDPDTYKLTFTNITIDNSNIITALWGSWDVACGGLVGMFRGAGHVYMTNCHVAAQIDVYNDVCGNYQYYWYRYSGMMVGTNKNMTTDANGYTVPETTKYHAENCTVHFGDWNDYYYCELVANSLASYTHDHQFSRLEVISSLNEIKSGDTWTKTGNFLLINGDTKTCYHIVQNADGTLKQHLHTDAGYDMGIDENGDGKDDLKEDKQIVYLPFNQLFTGYGWGVKHVPIYDDGTPNPFAGVTVLDRTVADSKVKFDKADTAKDGYMTEKTVTIGELFKAAAIDDEKLTILAETVNVFVSPMGESSTAGGTYVADTSDWTQGTLTFTGTGAATITITDYYFCTPTTITVDITEKVAAEKFETKFTGDFLYRVGNQNAVKLGSLFAAKSGTTIGNVSVEIEPVEGTVASGTYTANTTWTKGTIQFTGTGVVKVTITDNDYCIPTVLHLEVVDAKNTTTASGSNGTDVVLLNDVKISSNGTANYTNCTVYGNGFTFDICGGMNQYNSKQGHGIIIINNTTLDHLRIIGDVYDEYGMYTSTLSGTAQNDYTGAVDATNSIIQNCYIANCAAPIRSNGNTIIDTTLYGGTIANLLISGGTNTLTNVTTVNYNDGRGVIGMGIVITDGASAETTKLILNGYLKQYNYVYETDISEIKVEEAQTVFNSMFGNQFSTYHIGSSPKAVNAGIISINENINLDGTVFTDNANTGYQVKNDVKIEFNALGVTKSVDAAVASVPSSGRANNNYDASKDRKEQGDYLPIFNFELGDQMQAKDNDDDTRYLIGDKNGLTAMYPKGESPLTLNFTELATVSKYTGTSYPVTAKCVGPDGKEQTGVVTLDTKGTYTLIFTVEDNIFYDENGNKIVKSVPRTYEVSLVLDLYEKAIADATILVSSENLKGEWDGYSGNWKYTMFPLQAITKIMDDADKDGLLEEFDYKSEILSVSCDPAGGNAFSVATTIAITYNGGQVLELVLDAPSNCNSPGASNGGKTITVQEDAPHGIKIVSDGKIAKKCDGTWPITSWSFKGTSQKTVKSPTKVDIVFSASDSGDGSCLAAGTMITMADGTKRAVEDLRKGDMVMSMDHLTGKLTANKVIIVVKTAADNYYKNTFVFDDGTELVTINEHGIFDLDLNKYVNIDHINYEQFIGHRFVSIDSNGKIGTKKLIAVETVCESGYKYDIVTDQTLNYLAEDTLSVTHVLVDVINSFDFGEDLKYDAAKMQADIEKYGLYTYEEWGEYCGISVFEQYNIPVMKVGISKRLYTKEYIIGLINTYVLDESVQIID